MTKIIIQFESPDSTEFTVLSEDATVSQLLFLSRQLKWVREIKPLSGDDTVIEIEMNGSLFTVKASQQTAIEWRFQLVADMFYFAVQNMLNSCDFAGWSWSSGSDAGGANQND